MPHTDRKRPRTRTRQSRIYVISRGSRWGGPKVHWDDCQYIRDAGYAGMTKDEVVESKPTPLCATCDNRHAFPDEIRP